MQKLMRKLFHLGPPESLIENVSVNFDSHPTLPGMLEVEITIRAVVSPHILKHKLTSVAFGPKGKLEQFLRLAMPYVNSGENLEEVLNFANKLISKNKPQNPGTAKS
jgi:hypothetical protein